jgi:hypothetical protein
VFLHELLLSNRGLKEELSTNDAVTFRLLLVISLYGLFLHPEDGNSEISKHLCKSVELHGDTPRNG